MDVEQSKYSELVNQIGSLLKKGREQAAQSVNTILVHTYWLIGRHIVEYEQGGKEKAEYGSFLFEQLSKDLTKRYGKGFSRSNLLYMRKLYLTFPKSETLSNVLSWSHYFEILRSDNELEINFYARQTEKENWSVRELKRQMKSMLFHRLALSKDKKSILELAEQGQETQKAKDILKDPYVLEFLNIPENHLYLESELEEKLISNLQNFLLELGKGFTFEKRQYRISIGGKHFYVDLVFYHRILKCFVLIDLKRGEVTHQDVGQMNLYLNYFKKEVSTEGDNEPIGIVLGAEKDHILVEYATESINNQLFISKYQLYLPDKKQLENELNKLLDSE
ncbi:PDDEXK nuclease domain-containing protein [uncultured Chryseobacterium sp.]|uniref:PDDEXK nuclease domain-containing protein n=1 Tax=uncultured Chryseobacterium sp. TaxID=259322 RepID=UPI002589A2D9|nr:PDDEXK nuclease domain-containing protein [uncultured Chryseobacterium sp.]